MLIPIGDETNPPGIPWMTCLLIAANVLGFFQLTMPMASRPLDLRVPGASQYVDAVARQVGAPRQAVLKRVTSYDLFVFQRGGYVPARPDVLTLLSSMFLHVGFLHLLGNMIYLWIFGNNVEHRLGSIAFLLCYVATGAVATLSFAAFRSASILPLLGASGAISGVLGFYFVWFPHHKVSVLIVLFGYWKYSLEAWWVLVFYLVVDNVVPLMMASGPGGVAHSAHIGGFVAGVLAAKAIDAFGESDRSKPLRPLGRRG
jgi:membrane associated rhomboid family serine protease